MNNIAHSHFRVRKQGSARACAWYQISNQAAAPREPALRRLLKQALVNKWNPVGERDLVILRSYAGFVQRQNCGPKFNGPKD